MIANVFTNYCYNTATLYGPIKWITVYLIVNAANIQTVKGTILQVKNSEVRRSEASSVVDVK